MGGHRMTAYPKAESYEYLRFQNRRGADPQGTAEAKLYKKHKHFIFTECRYKKCRFEMKICIFTRKVIYMLYICLAI